MMSKLQLNIQMSIFSFCMLQIPLGFIALLPGKFTVNLIIFETIVCLTVYGLFYYFQFIQ